MTIRRVRELQPAHRSDKFTVDEAIRAFQEVRGGDPKPDIFDERRTGAGGLRPSGHLFIVDEGESIPVGFAPLRKKALPRFRMR